MGDAIARALNMVKRLATRHKKQKQSNKAERVQRVVMALVELANHEYALLEH
jgi:hypothetical protein